MIAGALAAAAWAAPCVATGAADAAYNQAAPVGAPVVLVLELWPEGAPPGWTEAVLDALDARDLRAGVVVSPEGMRGEAGLVVASAVARGHEPVLALPTSSGVSLDGPAEARAIAVEMKERVGARPRAVWSPLTVRRDEAILLQAGFRTMLAGAGGAVAAPRIGARFEDQIVETVVLPGGPYADACGTDPRVVGFLPSTGDRAATALRGAAAAGGFGVVRLELIGAGGTLDDAAQLARWLDAIVTPAGVPAVPPEEARALALKALDAPIAPVSADVGGRLVGLADVAAAAEALAGDVGTLPRTLPGGMTLTEGWSAFVLVAAGKAEGGVVRLGALGGPEVASRTALTGPTTLPQADIVATARAIVAAPPDRIPAALPFGGVLLTAAESLLAFASVARGEASAVVSPVGVPEPNMPGLGWGDATVP
jgi:hypothetical protein